MQHNLFGFDMSKKQNQKSRTLPLSQVIDLFAIHSNTNGSETEDIARKTTVLLWFSMLMCKYMSGIM